MDNRGGNQQIKRLRSFVTQRLKNLLAVPALLATLDENQMVRCNVYGLLSTAAKPASSYKDTEASQVTRNITSGGIHLHPRHDQRCDATCKGQPEDADHIPVLGLSRTGRQIRRASRANAGVRFSTWRTMVSQTKS
jgi:hypothetical protein